MSQKQTYGCEIEWADIDRTRPIPKGCGWDVKEVTIMNTNGVAVEGSGKHWKFGGELHTRVTDSIEGQCESFQELTALFPEAGLTHRNGLHVHVKIPGLAEDLESLKSLQRYVCGPLWSVIQTLEPIIPSTRYSHELAVAHAKRMVRSHQSFVSQKVFAAQMKADSVQEFLDAEAPKKPDGTPQHHLAPRCCVNLRQIFQTGTIEFRHFFSTLKASEFEAAVSWVALFLDHWRNGSSESTLRIAAEKYASLIPQEKPLFSLEREQTFHLTKWDGSIDRSKALEAATKFQEERPLPWEPGDCGADLIKQEQTQLI